MEEGRKKRNSFELETVGCFDIFFLEKERLVLVGNEKEEGPFGKVGKGEELIIFLETKSYREVKEERRDSQESENFFVPVG